MAGLILLLLGSLLLALLVYTKQVLSFRIRVFRWLNWHWAADLIERHFDIWVLLIRVIIVSVMILLLILGMREAV